MIKAITRNIINANLVLNTEMRRLNCVMWTYFICTYKKMNKPQQIRRINNVLENFIMY